MEKEPEQTLSLPHFKRKNLVEMVFSALRENILSGKHRDGDRLPSQDTLCRQLGVSRTVMREALNKLSSLGLIETRQGQGTFVRSPDAQSIMEPMYNALLLDESTTRELLETRYYLETIIVRLAAQRVEDSGVAKLEEIIKQNEKHVNNGDLKAVVEDDVAFHQTLAEISQNSILRRFLETISAMLRRFLESYDRIPGTPSRAVNYHKRILQAVAQKDHERAEAEMREHLLDVIQILRKKHNIQISL